jgi:hypothetical protein
VERLVSYNWPGNIRETGERHRADHAVLRGQRHPPGEPAADLLGGMAPVEERVSTVTS